VSCDGNNRLTDAELTTVDSQTCTLHWRIIPRPHTESDQRGTACDPVSLIVYLWQCPYFTLIQQRVAAVWLLQDLIRRGERPETSWIFTKEMHVCVDDISSQQGDRLWRGDIIISVTNQATMPDIACEFFLQKSRYNDISVKVTEYIIWNSRHFNGAQKSRLSTGEMCEIKA